MILLRSGQNARRRGIRVRGLPVVVLLLVSAGLAHAAADDMKAGSSPGTNPGQMESVITERLDSSKLRLGKGDWVVSGSIVDGLRRRRPSGDRSLGRRVLDFPIIRLFVPKPIPAPPGGGKYFLWGESSRPWAAISSSPRRLGSSDNPLYLEGGCSLISISR